MRTKSQGKSCEGSNGVGERKWSSVETRIQKEEIKKDTSVFVAQIYKKAVRETKRERVKETKRLRVKETKRQKEEERKSRREEERKRQREEETKTKKPLAINSNKPFLERNACRLLHHQDRVRLRRCGSCRHLRGRTAFQAKILLLLRWQRRRNEDSQRRRNEVAGRRTKNPAPFRTRDFFISY